MSLLLYCVFRGGPGQGHDPPQGAQQQPVSLVSGGDLSAAVSEFLESASPPEVETLLAYEKVVEHYFERATVLPMRYGCCLPGALEIEALLHEHREKYSELLQQFEGLAEMGLQVLSSESAASGRRDPRPAASARTDDCEKSGASYLSTRKAHYRTADRSAEQQNELVESLCDALADAFVRRKVERPAGECDRVCLYFLVPRPGVERFRELARAYRPAAHLKLLLSGPWPPYNFVDLSSGVSIS